MFCFYFVIKTREMFKELTKIVNIPFLKSNKHPMLNKEKNLKCRDFARPAIGITEQSVFLLLLYY